LFRDAAVRISFHVKGPGTNAIGVILMPVYNATKTDLLQVEEQKDPAYVSISGTSPVQIRLGNIPDALGISVTDVSVSAGWSVFAMRDGTVYNTYRVYPHSRLITPLFSGLLELVPNTG